MRQLLNLIWVDRIFPGLDWLRVMLLQAFLCMYFVMILFVSFFFHWSPALDLMFYKPYKNNTKLAINN
jgi:hypothetical protein